jgi:rare lipoprotein A
MQIFFIDMGGIMSCDCGSEESLCVMKTKEKFNISAYLSTAISLGGGGGLAAADTCTPYQQGGASWYGPGFHGRTTANGERYNMNGITAAHKTLPFGTKLRVIYNDKSVIVRINDRGPYVGKRIIDLSKGAADKLGLTDKGVGHVRLEKCR